MTFGESKLVWVTGRLYMVWVKRVSIVVVFVPSVFSRNEHQLPHDEQVVVITSLGNEGEHCLPPLGVSTSEFLLVSCVLLCGPSVHYCGGHDHEAIGDPATGHQGDGEPSKTLEKVVWERYERETVSLGNSPLAGPGRTKVAERDVGNQIGYLGEQPNCGTGPDVDRVIPGRATNIGRHRRILGTINSQCKEEPTTNIIMG